MATNNIFNLPSAEQIDELNTNLFNLILAEEEGENNLKLKSWSQIQRIVRSGAANKIFSIGDQLTCQRGNDTLVWDIIGIDHDTPADPQFTHSLTLQLHDCFPATMQFDAPEAFYYCHSALTDRTCHFTVSGTEYQFTTSADIDAGSQLILNFTGNTPTSIFVSDAVGGDFVKDTNGENNLTIAVTAGSGGDPLNGDYINDINRVNKGYNNYKESAIRQWLNRDAAAGSVWTPQNNFDRPPNWAETAAGFMNGMDADFLAVLGNVTKSTTKSGGSDTTADTFFLLSKSEVYGGLETSGDEGAAYPYYANYSGLSAAGAGEDGNRIKNDGSQAQNIWIRSVGSVNIHRRNTYINQKGEVSLCNSNDVLYVAPACCII